MGLLDDAAKGLGLTTGGLTSGLFSAASGLVSNLFGSSRQEDAQAFSAQQYATRYQTTVEDMKKAGLNPMLAYSQGAGSAPSSSAVSSQMPDVGSSVTHGSLASAQRANIEADTANKAAQADLWMAQAEQARASAGASTASIEQIAATVDKIREETKNIPDEGRRIRQTVQMLADQGALFAQKGETEVQMRKQMAALIAKLGSETTLLDLDVQAAKQLDNIGRTSKELKPVVDMIRMFIRR